MIRSSRTVPRAWSAGLLIGLLLGLLASGAAPVQAQPDPAATREEQARKHYKRGRAYHDLEQFDKAKEQYLLAYELSKAPKLLFNLGQVCRLAGDREDAAKYYALYLEKEPNSEISDIAREQRTELLAELAAEEAAREAEEARKAEAARAAEAAREARKALVAAEARAAAEAVDDAEAAAAASEAEEARAARQRRGRVLRITGIATAAVGVLALGLGGKFYLDASNASSELSDAEMWSPELSERYEEGESAERNATIAFAVGISAVALGGALYYFGARSGSAEQRDGVTVAPLLGPTTGGVTLSTRF